MSNKRVVSAEINGIKFNPIKGIKYKNDYVAIYESLATTKKYNEHGWKEIYRYLVKNDLFFIVYFVFGIELANNKFVVESCKEVEKGVKSYTLDIWGREHFKSTILTKAEPIQKILNNPNERIGIFSHTKASAKGFLRGIKMVLENSVFLHDLFPDILYCKPSTQSPKWSEDDGLIMRRNTSANEASIEACGLIDGMPIGKHYTHRIYDDISTFDLVSSPILMARLEAAYDMSENLGTVDGTKRIVGTYYHHADLLVRLSLMKDENGQPVYQLRKKPSLVGGKWTGKPVLLTQKRIDKLKLSPAAFKTQHLLNPTPEGTELLNPYYLQLIDEDMIPKNIQKFMTVDPAGDNKDSKGDAWAIMVFGVEPEMDEIGASRVFLLDACIKPLTQSEGIETIARMYIDAGVVQKLGVEKVGLSTNEIHVANALKKRGRHLSVENKNLVLLKPAGRNKVQRIEAALAWPLNNGKLYISTSIDFETKNRLLTEMRKFPFWHDDGLDAFSYVYDLLKDCTFLNMYDSMKIMNAFRNRIHIVDKTVGY